VEAIGSDGYMNSPHLSPREKAAVLWAEHVTKNTARSRDDVFEEVRRHFSDAEIVDLTLICAYFNMNNRFQDSLRIPLEEQEEVDKIKKSVRLNTGALRSYLGAILRDWPDEFPEPAPEAPAGR
jgi:hypothetical protein